VVDARAAGREQQCSPGGPLPLWATDRTVPTIASGEARHALHNAVSWETRDRGGRYYTRSRREGGRIVREYVGRGYVAELAARLDELDRERREDERAALNHERDRLEATEAPILALHEEVERLVRGALLAAGYHRHKGQWRRRRG
jgi:hypothetical protein